MSKQRRRRGHKRGKQKHWQKQPMLFSKHNYKIMLIGIALIAVGFGGMYIENAIHGIFSLYFAPLLIIGGLGVVAFGVLKTDPEQDLGQDQQT